MATVRIIKKSINNLCFDLISECYIYGYFHKDLKSNKLNEVIEDIVKLRNELITKVNTREIIKDAKKNRAFFNGIIKDMQKMVDTMDNLGKGK